MFASNKLRGLAVAVAVLLLLPADALQARTRKGDKFLKQAEAAEARKEYEKALDLYNQAISQDPTDAAYQLGARRVRFQASQVHVEAGMKLRTAGQLEEALVEFQKAFNVDPGSTIALQEIKTTTEALDQKRRRNVPPGEPPLTSAEKARKESLALIESMLPVPELRPVTNVISSLKMNNQPVKVLYETVGKLAGINVLFDPQYQPAQRNVNLDLNNTTLGEALDYIALLTKTYWKPVSANAIFVTDDNVTKRRDYEDEVVKVFYLKNPTTVQEFQEIVTSIRSVTDVRRMYTYNAQNAIIVRDTVDKVDLVEKLIHDMDKPKAEVVIDVIVMESNSDRTRTIASGLVNGSTNGLSLPVSFSPRNPVLQGNTGGTGTGTGTTGGTGGTGGTGSGTTTGGGIVSGITGGTTGGGTGSTGQFISLNQIGKVTLNDFSTSLPGALLQAVMSDNTTRVMQSPQVRASDGQKVSLKIGDKVPYATGSFQPGIGTVGVSPLVSTQFQFAETGVTLEITPHVHGTDELSMHILVDVSNVSRTVTIGGLDQPVISQRKNEADIRVRNGEVSLLGGLMQDQETNTQSGIPGLVNIPIFGKFFLANNSKSKTKGELLVALIPHIVRTPDITGLDLRGVAAGPDQVVKLRLAPRVEPAPAPAAAAPAPPGPTPAPPSPVPTAVAVPQLLFAPATVQAQLSGPVILTLQAQDVADLTVVPIKLKWDPKVLRLDSATTANLFSRDGQAGPPTLDIRNEAGEASIEINRVTGAAGVSGTGPVLQLTFMAIGKGSTTVAVTDINPRNSKQQPVRVTAPSVAVTVQ